MLKVGDKMPPFEVVDQDGILERIIEKVDTKNAASQILID